MESLWELRFYTSVVVRASRSDLPSDSPCGILQLLLLLLHTEFRLVIIREP